MEDKLEEYKEIEDNFAYGGKFYDDHDQLDCKDYGLNEMKRTTYSEFYSDPDAFKLLKKRFRTHYLKAPNPDIARTLKISERSMTMYPFKTPDKNECNDFIIKNKAGKNKFLQFFLKVKIALTQSSYFESLFPAIKEQKPGFDLYAPMASIQCIIIVFMIFFYTRMDPDYTNITSDDLTPTTFNQIMVIAVFVQIGVIVLDRFLYLSRDYVVIDEVDLEEDSDEELEDVSQADSLSQFDRKKTFDLRSSSGGKLLVKGLGMKDKKKYNVKGKVIEKKGLDELSEDSDYSPDEVQLSKTNFNKTMVLKYYLQLFMLLLIHIITFWYFPIKANVDLQVTPYCVFNNPQTGHSCNEVFMNWTLVLFYLLYCLYFAISALQIRFGLPELRKGNFAMSDTGPINKGIFQGYLAAPFIVELKIVSDWTFTRTALDLFQWIKFENIYGDLFLAKCTNKGYLEHPLGEPMPIWKKASFGCCGLFILILIIAGPLLLFSSFNPLAENNFVTGASLRLMLVANLTDDGVTNQYELFNTERFTDLRPIQDKYYDRIRNFRNVRNLQRDLFQQVVLSRVSDSVWSISPPTQREIYEKLISTQDGDELTINVVMIYAFDRPQPADQQRTDKELPIIDIFDTDIDYRIQVSFIQKY